MGLGLGLGLGLRLGLEQQMQAPKCEAEPHVPTIVKEAEHAQDVRAEAGLVRA